jgi:hypothetical protein
MQQFSIYDHKNMFLDGSAGMADSNLLYVGTSKSETDYAYMKPGPAGAAAWPEGGQITAPYAAEFRIMSQEEPEEPGDPPPPVVLTVLGAKAKTDAGGKPQFNADGSPVAPSVFTVVGQLTVPEPEDAMSYRVAVSGNKYKWFKVTVTGGKASAFLLRG